MKNIPENKKPYPNYSPDADLSLRVIGKTEKVPVRRGTGPKASIKRFLAAYDAWAKFRRDNDPMEWGDEELEEDDRLFCAMFAARAEVKGVMGAV